MNGEGGGQVFSSQRQRLHTLGKARHNVILLEDGTRRERWRSGDKKRGGGLRLEKERGAKTKEEEEERVEGDLQFKGLIPGGVEAALDGLGLLLALVARVRDQFQLHVGV